MATKLTRKDLKTDRFAIEVGHTVEYVGEHRQQLMRYAAIGLGVAVLALGLFFYRAHQRDVRQEALAQAIKIQEAPAGGAPPGIALSFPSQEEKDKAALKAFGDLAAKYSGFDEGTIARYYLACINADQGKLADAEKLYKEVSEKGDAKYASLAKLALGQIYFLDGHNAEGEKLLRGIMASPTIFVSKEQATVALARSLAKSNPAEARKLLEPLRTQRAAVGQTAMTLLAEIGQ